MLDSAICIIRGCSAEHCTDDASAVLHCTLIIMCKCIVAIRYWTLMEEKADRWQAMQHLLPSDCSRRLDLQTLLTGNVEAAQLKKVELENLQRTDAKIRKAAGSTG